MLTCAADINGKLDDARLDWEIVGYNENGNRFSIDHGSIGTFIPKDKSGTDRERWTYQHGLPNSVWPEFDRIISKKFKTDTGRDMRVIMSGIDAGYMTQYAYTYLDNTNNMVVGLKGKDVDKYTLFHKDVKTYKQARERPNLYLVEANTIKDRTASDMRLKWNPQWHEVQPTGFMNFPTPSGGKYLFSNYFSHFEAEHKVIDKDTTFRWLKKSNNHQNHLWDCHLYNLVVRDIFLDKLFKELKIQNGSWKDFADIITGRRKK
jgi:phage terminase large subunit GpA-like protein